MERLEAQLRRRYFREQEPLLSALLAAPCQARQYYLGDGVSAEDFARYYAVLRQLGVAADLDVPVYKNGRMTERRVTIYRAFSEQLVGQCLAPVAAGVLSSEHFAIV